MTNKDIDMIQENIRRDSFKNEYWGIYQEVWNFHKKYSNVQSDDSYWENLIESASEIDKKYNCRLCRDLVISILNELDFRSRNGRARSLDDKLYQGERDQGG